MRVAPLLYTADTMLQQDDEVLLDVRTPAEFREAHIPGSVNLPLGDLPRDCAELRERFDGKRVTVVCDTGRRAEQASLLLCTEGLDCVEVLPGGVEAWRAAGRELDRGAQGVSVERQVRITAGALVILGVALGLAVHPAFLGLAAFVGAGLVFAGVTDTCGMAAVLVRMPWNRAKSCRIDR